MRWWPSGGLWRHPDFLRLWGAQIGSAFGSRITRTALPMAAILTLGASPSELALLSALGVAPAAAVGLLLGGRIDRSHKRPWLIGADLARAALTLSVPAAASVGALSMPQLCLVAAAVGACTALFQIADHGLLPSVIGRDRLLEGNSRLQATESVAEALGPGIGGLLVGWLTAPIAILVDSASYLWSALLLSGLRAEERLRGEADATVLGDLWIGLRACLADPRVRPLLLADALTSLFGGFFLALYTLALLDGLGLSPATFGAVVSVGGLGAFGASWIAGPLGRRLGEGVAIPVCLAVGLCGNLLIPLALSAGAGAVPLLLVQQLVGDAFGGAYGILAVSLRQRTIPEEVLGRSHATFGAVTGGMLPLGALLAGPLAEAIGLGPTLWIASLGMLPAVPILLPLAWRCRTEPRYPGPADRT